MTDEGGGRREPSRKWLYGAIGGVLAATAIVSLRPFGDGMEVVNRYLVRGGTFLAFDPEWRSLDGMMALGLSLTLDRNRPPPQSHYLDGDLLVALCGAVLSDLPRPREGAIAREGTYRLDLRFMRPNGDGFSDPLPIEVVGGACVVDRSAQMLFWSYPGALAGWQPVEMGTNDAEGSEVLVVWFQRVRDEAVPMSEFDAVAACRALTLDPPPSIADALKAHGRWRIVARNGLVTPPKKFGAYRATEFTIIDGKCAPAAP
jgi:hypothetical protein